MRILWKWIMHSVLIEEQNILDWRILQLEIHKLCIPLVMWWMMQWRIIISQIWSRGIISEKSYLVGQVNKKIFRNISQNLWLLLIILSKIRELRLKRLMRILRVCNQVRLFLISKKMQRQILSVRCSFWKDGNSKKNLTKTKGWTTFLDQDSEVFFLRKKLSSGNRTKLDLTHVS